jgi:MinD-like ATPase involved in chromosome partitioning or flagellar assembly
MIDFSDTIPTARRVVEAAVGSSHSIVTIIRDLKGRIALFLEFDAEPDPALEAKLKVELTASLECFWSGRLWLNYPSADQLVRALGARVRNERIGLEVFEGETLSWHLIDRTYSKRGWLERRDPPWPNSDRTPAIVSFYSFKGGVGRSTALAASALLLARAGKKIVVVDLDLEAPGVFTLFDSTTSVDEGVVDYLIHKAIGDRDYRLELCMRTIADAAIIGETGSPIVVLPAGRIDSNYIDKIARVDMNGDAAAEGLEGLLREIKREYSPDFIFLDVRAGLHDIGGLSLNTLSHMNILFCLDTPQSWNGLYPVLEILAKAEDREVLLVHAMATPRRLDPKAHEKFRARAFEAFQEHYFSDDEEMPDIGDDSAPYGVPLYEEDSLSNLASFALPGAQDPIFSAGSPYRVLVQKIGERLGRSTE